MVDDGGSKYDNVAYQNIKATASTGKVPQTWTLEDNMMLSATSGSLYGYYPYNSTVTDITQIPVTAGDTDYMYATPVQGLDNGNYNAAVTMNHALAAIRVTVCKTADNDASATLTDLKVQSEAFHQSATLDAKTGQLSGWEGAGAVSQATALNQTLTYTGTTYDFIVVPGTVAADITFTTTIGGDEFTVNAEDVALQQGCIHAYTLSFSKQEKEMVLTSQTVKDWNKHDKVSLGMNHKDPWKNLENGVYAVSADGKPVEVASATSECIAVALITDNQKIMIAPQDATDGTNEKLYWGYKLIETNITGINNYSDETAAKVDFAGAANTAAIIAAYTEHSVEMDSRDMSKVLQNFNAGSDNLGYNDWYVPAAGQLYEICIFKSDINTALTKIGGTTIADDLYWSSSNYGSSRAWGVSFYSGNVNYYYRYNYTRVRLVRDIE